MSDVAHKLESAFKNLLEKQIPERARQLILEARRITFEKEFSPEVAEFGDGTYYKIPGIKDYAVNAKGKILSRKKKNGLLDPIPDENGYIRVELRDNPTTRLKPYVHDLVLRAFVGPRPSDNHVARHENDQKDDNRLENLSWGTRQDNSNDLLRNQGKKALSQKEKKEIWVRYGDGATQNDLAEQYGVSQSTISRVIRYAK